MPLKEVLEHAEKRFDALGREEKIKAYDRLFDQTLDLIRVYVRHGLTPPFGLRGNLGEFIVVRELLDKFPRSKVKYYGGSHPGIDILVDKVRIQVKTQFKHEIKRYLKTGGELDFESSPTIKKSTIEGGKCDILVLLILYFDRAYSKLEKRNIHIFNQPEFMRYFDHRFCWTGKSKKDYTIVNVLSVKGNLSNKMREKIEPYNCPEYKKLFQRSKVPHAWSKIEELLKHD